MQEMTQTEYIKKFCDNKYSVWKAVSAAFPHKFEQVAFYDRHIWRDEQRGIEIVDSFYVGD